MKYNNQSLCLEHCLHTAILSFTEGHSAFHWSLNGQWKVSWKSCLIVNNQFHRFGTTLPVESQSSIVKQKSAISSHMNIHKGLEKIADNTDNVIIQQQWEALHSMSVVLSSRAPAKAFIIRERFKQYHIRHLTLGPNTINNSTFALNVSQDTTCDQL